MIIKELVSLFPLFEISSPVTYFFEQTNRMELKCNKEKENIEEKKMKRSPFTSLVCLLVTHSTFSQINGHPRMKTLSSLLHFWKLGTPEMESLPSALDHQDHQ